MQIASVRPYELIYTNCKEKIKIWNWIKYQRFCQINKQYNENLTIDANIISGWSWIRILAIRAWL